MFGDVCCLVTLACEESGELERLFKWNEVIFRSFQSGNLRQAVHPADRPRSTVKSDMSSIHRSSRTPGTPMTPEAFHG